MLSKIMALSLFLVSTVFASTYNDCQNLIIAFHNGTDEAISVNYQVPSDVGESALGIIIKPGETYPFPKVSNDEEHDNTWIGLQLFDSKQAPILKEIITKIAPQQASFWTRTYDGWIDPPGEIIKESSGFEFDDAHYIYTEEYKFKGSCTAILPGIYFFKISKKI
jgi:hypothetical protein